MQQPNTVEFARAEYVANLPIWRTVSDACAGQYAIKARREEYLPRPNVGDSSSEADKRYDSYLARAVYYNSCGRTLAGLVGMAFDKDPETKTPGRIAYLEQNADGAGVPLVQCAQGTAGEVLRTGRSGLLVDFPKAQTAGNGSAEDIESGVALATFQHYPAHSIINWRSERIGASLVLTLVVLREVEDSWDGFGMQFETRYRVLRLQDGVYVQEIWRIDPVASKGKRKPVFKLDEMISPLDANGRPWDEIPFGFAGAVSNHADIESRAVEADSTPYSTVSPLYDIAVLNIAHYRNSADYEDSTFLCGQPQPWVSGLSEEWRDVLVKSGITLGSRSVLPLPVGGAFGMEQANPNTLASEAMRHKEAQMSSLGARLIISYAGSKTATQAGHEASNDNSVLGLVCDNVSALYRRALQWAARFMGESGETGFSIDTKFTINSLDAASIQAIVQAWQAGALPETDMWSGLRKLGAIDPQKSDEVVRAELEAQRPLVGGGGANDPTELLKQLTGTLNGGSGDQSGA